MLEEIDRLTEEEQATRNDVLRLALKRYLQSQEVWKRIFQQGEMWARELGIRNEEDVDRIIHEFREEQSAAESGL
jgi:hypothetical protein